MHAMHEAYNDDSVQAILLVNASNAFNSLNRKAALCNIQHLCPSLATILINMYRPPANLYVHSDTLLSRGGTTQGDPLAMSMYSVGILPLIHCVSGDVKQVWYANDATAAGELSNLWEWWDNLVTSGPDFGYFVNASKTSLVVKKVHLADAVKYFENTNVQISTEGKPHLGAALGTEAFVHEFVSKKVQQWVEEVLHLSSIASTQTHAAFSAFTWGLSSKWTYISRTIEELFEPLEDAICSHFIPALTGMAAASDIERNLFALPCRGGGIGVANPMRLSNSEYLASVQVTKPLTDLIMQQNAVYLYEAQEAQLLAKFDLRRTKRPVKIRHSYIPSTLNVISTREKCLQLANGPTSGGIWVRSS